jgi:hypothetical protein
VHGIGQLAELDALVGQLLLAHELGHCKDDAALAADVAFEDGLNTIGVQGGIIAAQPFTIRLVKKVNAE